MPETTPGDTLLRAKQPQRQPISQSNAILERPAEAFDPAEILDPKQASVTGDSAA